MNASLQGGPSGTFDLDENDGVQLLIPNVAYETHNYSCVSLSNRLSEHKEFLVYWDGHQCINV